MAKSHRRTALLAVLMAVCCAVGTATAQPDLSALPESDLPQPELSALEAADPIQLDEAAAATSAALAAATPSTSLAVAWTRVHVNAPVTASSWTVTGTFTVSIPASSSVTLVRIAYPLTVEYSLVNAFNYKLTATAACTGAAGSTAIVRKGTALQCSFVLSVPKDADGIYGAPARVTAAVSLATSPTVTAASASIAADAPYQPTLPLTVVSPNDLAGTIIPPSAVQRYWTLTVTSKSVLPAYLLRGQVSIPARGITGSLDCNLAATLPGAPRRAYFTVSSTKSISCLILFPSGRVLSPGTIMTGSLSFTNGVSKLVTPFITRVTVTTP